MEKQFISNYNHSLRKISRDECMYACSYFSRSPENIILIKIIGGWGDLLPSPSGSATDYITSLVVD